MHSGCINNGIDQSFQDNKTVNYGVDEEFGMHRYPI